MTDREAWESELPDEQELMDIISEHAVLGFGEANKLVKEIHKRIINGKTKHS